MKIEHAALYVNDLDNARKFYETYFGGKAGALYHNPRTNFQSYFLSFDDGVRLELMTKPEVKDIEKDINRLGWAHLTFSVGSKEMVDELTARLVEDGYEKLSGPRTTGDGYYESCVLDPEGNQIEITV